MKVLKILSVVDNTQNKITIMKEDTANITSNHIKEGILPKPVIAPNAVQSLALRRLLRGFIRA